MVRPTVDALIEVIDSARTDRENRNLPNADSPAMAEWSIQTRFADSDEGPVDVARTMSSLTLFAGEDHLRAMCTLLREPNESFAWSVPVMVRAALEAFAQSRHLSEGGIGLLLRSARTMNELIDSARNIHRLPPAALQPNSDPHLRRKQALALGLTPFVTKKQKSTPWFEEERPNVTTLVSRLMGDNELGATIYNYLSAVAHSSPWGLTETMGDVESHPSGIGHQAPIIVNLDFVRTIAGTAVLAHGEAFDQFMRWNGWSTESYADARPHLGTVLGPLERSPPDDARTRRPSWLWTPDRSAGSRLAQGFIVPGR